MQALRELSKLRFFNLFLGWLVLSTVGLFYLRLACGIRFSTEEMKRSQASLTVQASSTSSTGGRHSCHGPIQTSENHLPPETSRQGNRIHLCCLLDDAPELRTAPDPIRNQVELAASIRRDGVQSLIEAILSHDGDLPLSYFHWAAPPPLSHIPTTILRI